MMNTPKIIKHLILINVIMYLATSLRPGLMYSLFAMHFPENPDFHWWQIVTHMFMHGGFWHILFNMYALWAFGSPLIMHFGEKRFLVFYFLSGLGAIALFLGVQYYEFYGYLHQLEAMGFSASGIFHILHSADPEGAVAKIPALLYNSSAMALLAKMLQIYHMTMLGASGAIYGILVAFGFFYPRAKLMLVFLPYPIEARYFIPLLILADIFFGITNYLHLPIAHFAHVGGALTGLLLMWLWRKHKDEYYYY